MKKYLFFLLILILACFGKIPAQEPLSDSTEIFLIDSYVTPETPNMFVLSFITSKPCRSRVVLENKYNFNVSDNLAEEHKISIDISSLKFDSFCYNC
jgi:hypothetical protein